MFLLFCSYFESCFGIKCFFNHIFVFSFLCSVCTVSVVLSFVECHCLGAAIFVCAISGLILCHLLTVNILFCDFLAVLMPVCMLFFICLRDCFFMAWDVGSAASSVHYARSPCVSVSGRAMVWNAHCKIPSHVLCGTTLVFISVPIPHPFPQGSPCTCCLTHSPMSPCGSHQRHGPLRVEGVTQSLTSPSSASSSSRLSTGSLLRAPSSACAWRDVLPAPSLLSPFVQGCYPCSVPQLVWFQLMLSQYSFTSLPPCGASPSLTCLIYLTFLPPTGPALPHPPHSWHCLC